MNYTKSTSGLGFLVGVLLLTSLLYVGSCQNYGSFWVPNIVRSHATGSIHARAARVENGRLRGA